jgi:hypothetical protein
MTSKESTTVKHSTNRRSREPGCFACHLNDDVEGTQGWACINAETRFEASGGIKVSYVKYGQILKLRKINMEDIWSFGRDCRKMCFNARRHKMWVS